MVEIPKFHEFMTPLLLVLKENGEMYRNDAFDATIEKVGLTDEQKAENNESAKVRIVIEHVNRRCKIFRLVKDSYRGKHRNYNKNWNCVAGLVNMRYLAA